LKRWRRLEFLVWGEQLPEWDSHPQGHSPDIESIDNHQDGEFQLNRLAFSWLPILPQPPELNHHQPRHRNQSLSDEAGNPEDE
jgi:hypothetical protein